MSSSRAASAAAMLVSVGVVSGYDCCWCDKDTPAAKHKIMFENTPMQLVFSDEFNQAGRTFANGKDSKWTALDIGDTSNQGTAFYLPNQAYIKEDPAFKGVSALVLRTENQSHVGTSPTGQKGVKMPYRSAMVQTWNKFCFTGGVVEWRARMPRGSGYWPALWLFGNLGRAVFQNSNTGLWPWSYNECDEDLFLPPTSPNQRISACDHYDIEKDGLHAYQGRGATELDVLEGAVTNNGKASYVVGSLQLSPGIPAYFKPPLYEFPTAFGAGQWYTGLTFGLTGRPNDGWYGPPPPNPNLDPNPNPNPTPTPTRIRTRTRTRIRTRTRTRTLAPTLTPTLPLPLTRYGPPWGSTCPTGCPDALSGGITERDDLDTRYWLAYA